jgi:hypothetical protein
MIRFWGMLLTFIRQDTFLWEDRPSQGESRTLFQLKKMKTSLSTVDQIKTKLRMVTLSVSRLGKTSSHFSM